MPSAEQLRSRLLKKLSELFQLDQPDLDFGFYRIMHAKSAEVQDFIGTDLLKIVADAFGDADEARKAELQAAYEKAIQTAKDFGAPNPEETSAVKKAKAALDAVKDTASAEADVYDHLYRFFERYYDDGDFISRRYYTRETSGKAAPFAVPYNGEEVKLHWANADQYYIKSAEYFSNFTFTMSSEQSAMNSKKQSSMFTDHCSLKRVHFRVVEATEGEHGNVKASEANKRFFILHAENPVALLETGELVVNFEYRPDPEKNGQENTWRDKRNTEAVETILERLENMAAAGGEHEKQLKEYLRLLKVPAPTDSDKKRPVLAKYVNQYTARNTMDYFIHKDLGGFLRRELDFYIKNEVMRLDDIENAEAPAVESYLAKIKVLRKIAGKLIDFLAQLEDFQKKLWLKKKFVVETQYCMTLDRIFSNEQSTMNNEQKKSPQLNIDHCSLNTEQTWLLQQVVENKAQWVEWQKLGFVQLTINNEQLTEKAVLETDDFTIIFNGEKLEDGLLAKEPLTYRNLIDDCSLIIDHWNLVLDTRFFDDSFKVRLVASIENFDDQCDGLLIHSENFQALNLLQERYREQVKCVYIDPPYNAAATEIFYKNGYKSSSWCSLIHERLIGARKYLTDSGILCVTIDDYELYNLKKLGDLAFSPENYLSTVLVRNNPSGRSTVSGFAICHEYALFYANKIENCLVGRLPHSDEQKSRYDLVDKDGKPFEWENFRKSSAGSYRNDRPKQYFPIYLNENNNKLRIPECEWNDQKKEWVSLEQPLENEVTILPIDSQRRQRVWNFGVERTRATLDEMKVEIRDGKPEVYKKKYLQQQGILPRTWWEKPEYSARDSGTRVLSNLFAGQKTFDFPKAVVAVKDALLVGALSEADTVLDFFAGSGTTGHAVIDLNREDELQRRFILVEMGDYFDTVLKPRIAKVVYSESWKDGKPVAMNNGQSTMNKKKDGSLVTDHCSLFNGVSHCMKYIRLESYEDTLNNLRLDHNTQRKKAVAANPALKEDYMLRYLLDVETRGSQSLLNIDAFADPCRYTLEVKKPGTDEYATRAVDLIETFNYLIGLRVLHSSVPQTFQATFKRITDPELPEDQHTKLVVDGRIRRVNEQSTMSNEHCSLSTDHCPLFWFRKVEGWVPKDAANPNNSQQEKVLVVWRKLTDDIEQDNLMLDEWFQSMRISTRDFEFDTIYVNGSNNLPNLKLDDENWKVRLIEEEFMKRMWEAQQ